MVHAVDNAPNGVHDEYPRAADLREMMRQNPLPVLEQGAVDIDTGIEAELHALLMLETFETALASHDVEALESCFLPTQAYWKDLLALTWDLRTFTTPSVISAGLLETVMLRGLKGHIQLEGAQITPVTPVLQFIDCRLVFETLSPAASCSGRMLLFPIKRNDITDWKIWILSTWLENLAVYPEDEKILHHPGRQLDRPGSFETDVFIVGGGNAAIALAARLKTLGVESVMAERTAKPGDNWAHRYDCMRFHVPTASTELPYMRYPEHLQSPNLLSRDDLAEHVRRYVKTFNLNMTNSARIQSTLYDPSTKRWTVTFSTPDGKHTAVAKHLVQATGFGSQQPYLPSIADEGLYKGISVHSAQYKNAAQLKEKGVKSVLIIGSANTAFDLLQDCHAASLRTTMAARSPTYLLPIAHVCDPHAFGAYDTAPSVDAADRQLLTLPTWVEAHLVHGLFAALASAPGEKDRYAALKARGFPVLEAGHPDAVLSHYLLERAGGHYVDVGGSRLIAEGEVGVVAGVEPVAYTERGLRFSDGRVVEADAVVWCTGFADKDARRTAAGILGGGDGKAGGPDGVGAASASDVLGPEEIAARLDATWGVDDEGEVRGIWKRQSRLENYWVMGGHTAHHRWHSRTVALQIKAELEGILPPAYRETPGWKN